MAYLGDQDELEIAKRIEKIIIEALQDHMEEDLPAVPVHIIAGVLLHLTAVFAVGEECCYKADRMVEYDSTLDAMNRELVGCYEHLNSKYLSGMN